jgi:BirA family biotin operon repressor/biotin-[acetyl-CoA-carboxylase] ligase
VFTTRDKIALSLDGQKGRVISGAALAKEFRLTRAAVWKHIKALQQQGLPIVTRKASGYRLREAFDFSLLRRDAARRNRAPWHYQWSVRSTQELAKYAADQGAGGWELWLAEQQTAGKGRMDRAWESGLGGLWFSLLIRTELAPTRVPALALVIGLCLVEVLEKRLKLPVKLKWPNDLVLKTDTGWRKIAGVLTELSAEIDRTRWIVAGIGLNVNNSLPAALKRTAVSLREITGETYDRSAILEAFLKQFKAAFSRFEREGFEAFQQAYWNHYSQPDSPVELNTAQGSLRGRVTGVDARGALLVESGKQTQAIWEGEIVLPNRS